MKLTIFDLDNTILKGDSDYSWIEFLINNNHVDRDFYRNKNDYFYDQYVNGKLDIHEYCEFALSTFIILGKEKAEKLLDIFMKEIIEPMVNVYILRVLHEHYEAGDTLLLASATNTILVNRIGARLDFKNIIGTDPEIKNGSITGKILGDPAIGDGKLKKVVSWMQDNGKLDFRETTFYSDSINDLPLLESVEKPIAVNPDDSLRKESILRGWEIIDLT
ncbi:HAD-IB family hydrolase [Gammaproteobacteria bacterium]|jgi:HAD superfamily hydrolase (TIGR01490 family)|nr:HAD-IB family hydrolase [Gammaproteobacteria bacterium]